MHLRKSKPKGIAIDGIPIRRSSELMGLINIIFFSPEDLKIIKNGPSERRRFINMELSQLDHVYLHDLGEYNKILNQRNKLLKQIYYNPSLKDTLEIWDGQLLDYGSRLIRRRREFVEQLKEIVYHINQKLTGGMEQLNVHYEPDAGEDQFEKKLKDSMEKDLRFMTTNVGPHRDDLSFFNGDVDLRNLRVNRGPALCP
jgi:DNA replication and repair protein RecF